MSNDLYATGICFQDMDEITYLGSPMKVPEEKVLPMGFDYNSVKTHFEIPFRVFDHPNRTIWYYFCNEDVAKIFTKGMEIGIGAGKNPKKYYQAVVNLGIQQMKDDLFGDQDGEV